MSPSKVKSQPRMRWLVVAGLLPAVAAVGSAVLVGSVLRGEGWARLLLAAAGLVALWVTIPDVTERYIVNHREIILSRPPLRKRVIRAAEVERVVQETPDQVLIYVRRARRALNIKLVALENRGDFLGALLAFARRNEIPIEESSVYRELVEEE